MKEDNFVLMPTFCTLCRKEARDSLGNYYVRKDGKSGIYCSQCVNKVN